MENEERTRLHNARSYIYWKGIICFVHVCECEYLSNLNFRFWARDAPRFYFWKKRRTSIFIFKNKNARVNQTVDVIEIQFFVAYMLSFSYRIWILIQNCIILLIFLNISSLSCFLTFWLRIKSFVAFFLCPVCISRCVAKTKERIYHVLFFFFDIARNT